MYINYTAVKVLGNSVIKLKEGGLVEIDCNNNHEYSVEVRKKNRAYIKELADDKKMLVFSNLPEFTTASKETREFVAQGGYKDFIFAYDFVIQSLAQKILGNFFLTVNKPIVSAKIFTNKEDTISWLAKLS